MRNSDVPKSTYHTLIAFIAFVLGLFVSACISRALPQHCPQRRVNRQRGHLPGLRVEECAVICEFPVTEELSQHGECAHSECLIDVWFLAIESLNGRATRQRIFAGALIANLGEQFADRAQPLSSSAVAGVERLPEDILPAGCVVAEVPLFARIFPHWSNSKCYRFCYR